jgi:phosphatidylcholine synthase
VTAAWLVHAYTASGVVLALLAALAVIENDFRAAFFWLWLQVVVDATDGLLARRARVAERLPWFDGAALDQIVDYLTYVFVPALVAWRAPLVPDGWTIPVASGMLLSSAYAFSRKDAKTTDNLFTGWPSYWNVVTFYLLVLEWPAVVNAAVLGAFAVLVFIPIRYVYPSRTPVLSVVTNVLGATWAALMLVMLWQYPTVSRVVLWASFVFPLYYHGLSFALHMRRSRSR